ncbi:PP2C family protein-serine/threonine phosphatase [Halalkalibacter alkaliphilus]|uniref:Serine/threonine-protein phosphatase n=1 Tax=Halalkalibacter alkaliphilus TaxID=2917993 RepID=A0A9X2CNI9_9BACI|nr:PP2C family protein-serine/threonine phosphatase [Halalkalibacter alkaliphilus]MCL7746713.1 serine/threonine-protein phosphatase [Halalkalibacter alkaliphilus]
MYYDGLTVSKQSSTKEMDKTLQREINLAKNIQATLLNGSTPKINKGEVIGSSLPARLIGGDYYDFYPLANGKIRIVIGDVMGKGIPAAMLMILTRGAFRTAAESMSSPGATLTAMNQALYNDLRKLKSFVTLFCADWDPDTEILTYANAGHNMPLYINGDNREVTLLPKVKGIMVGGLPNQVYKEETIKLKNNDTVFFYTDGIVEAQNKAGDQYQLERLTRILENHQDSGVGAIEKSVIDSVHSFMDGALQKDDITMVVLKLTYENSNITSLNSPVLNV